MKQRIFTVIVNWNGKRDTLNCLSSLGKIRHGNVELSCIVVDNGSADDSVKAIKSEFPEVTVLSTGKNLGFTGGNNAGIAYALGHGADYIWLLNNDTVVDTDVLSFVSAFADPKAGACGSKIYFAPGHEYHRSRYSLADGGRVIWYAGGKIDWKNMYASHRGVDEVDKGQYDRQEETPFITGCSFVIRASVVRSTGMLDDRYYLYLEDLDWSLRIQRAGWKTVYVPASKVWHINAGSTGRPGNPLHEYYLTRNRLLFGFRYAPARTKYALVREAIRILFTGPAIRRRAVVDAFFGRFGKQYEPKNIS
jgi:GT2 family glycosyltransferase